MANPMLGQVTSQRHEERMSRAVSFLHLNHACWSLTEACLIGSALQEVFNIHHSLFQKMVLTFRAQWYKTSEALHNLNQIRLKGGKTKVQISVWWHHTSIRTGRKEWRHWVLCAEAGPQSQEFGSYTYTKKVPGVQGGAVPTFQTQVRKAEQVDCDKKKWFFICLSH